MDLLFSSDDSSYSPLMGENEEMKQTPEWKALVLTANESTALHDAVTAGLEDLFHESAVFSKSDVIQGLPVLTRAPDLGMGRELGQGGFCQVFEYNPSDDDSDDDRLVVKVVSSQQHDSTRAFTLATKDIVREAHFLSIMKHDHIVVAHGMGSTDIGKVEHFFLVLERLVHTLEDVPNDTVMSLTNPQHRLLQRLQWGLEISRAVAYLHSQKVIYRDLKTCNVGLDRHGVVKLFDFGLAKELKASQVGQDGKYRLSGKTGSWRTMAPEVAKGWHYNEKVDVYSFGILLWELLSGNVAFEGMSEEDHLRLVVNGQERPPFQEDWPSEVKDLMQRCWSFFPNARPSMEVVESGMSYMVSRMQKQIDQEHADRIRIFRRVAVIILLICGLLWYLLIHKQSIRLSLS